MMIIHVYPLAVGAIAYCYLDGVAYDAVHSIDPDKAVRKAWDHFPMTPDGSQPTLTYTRRPVRK